jgi:hypothetical protein
MNTDLTNTENLKTAVSKSGADGLTIWALYTHDVYERAFGDGYWPSLARLFFKEEEAIRCADWIRDFSGRSPQLGYGTEIRKMRLVLEGESLHLKGPVGEYDEGLARLSGTEEVLDAFSGTYDWHDTVKRCKELYPEAQPPEVKEAVGSENEKE